MHVRQVWLQRCEWFWQQWVLPTWFVLLSLLGGMSLLQSLPPQEPDQLRAHLPVPLLATPKAAALIECGDHAGRDVRPGASCVVGAFCHARSCGSRGLHAMPWTSASSVSWPGPGTRRPQNAASNTQA